MCVLSAAAAAAAALCVAILLLLLQQQCCCFLLLFVIVCRTAKFVCWFIGSDPSVFFLFTQRRFLFLMVPLGSTIVSRLRPRFAYTLGNYGRARSQGGRQPTAAKPPLYYVYT